MNNKEAIFVLKKELDGIPSDIDKSALEKAVDLAIKALEKDKCSSCKHYDKDYGETCLNPEGTCRVFEYDGYKEVKDDAAD